MLPKSKYPPLLPIPDDNVHNLYFSSLPGASDIPDYDLYIDAATGKRVTSHAFREAIRDTATALCAPSSQQGLNISHQAGDIVGIYSHNCIVSQFIQIHPFT